MMMPDNEIHKPLDLLRHMQNWAFFSRYAIQIYSYRKGSDNYQKKLNCGSKFESNGCINPQPNLSAIYK